MCILFFVANGAATGDEYKLILAANRDEYYARPALPAGRWQGNEFVIGGKDMEPGREGGTWLAISTVDNTFKFGALLNITGEKKEKDAMTRGNIVVDYVVGSQSNAEYCQEIIDSKKKYNCFSLVTVEISDKVAKPLQYYSVTKEIEKWPERKVLGFGNSSPSKPLAKVKVGQKLFEEIVNNCENQSKDQLVDNLSQLLCNNKKRWPDDELRRRAPSWCESLSSICVKMPEDGYGSRTRTIVLVDANNNVDFYEDTMATTDPDGEWIRSHFQTKF